MPLTVLSNTDIHSLLITLTRDDIAELQHNLAEALHDYSTGTQESTIGCSANQPQRIAVPAANKQITLFMPASTSTSRGLKIITLATAPVPSSTPSLSKLSIDSPRSGSPAPKSPSISIASSRSSTTLASYTSSVSSAPSADPSVASSQTTTPRGSLTLLTSTGIPYAFLDAEALTAFRTALASTIIFNRRSNVHSITVFGAGEQAKWHIRLALMLRGSEIHHVDIINRSFARAKALMHEFYTSPEWEDLRNANSKLAFSIVSSEFGEYQRLLKQHIRKADVIFLCTPSTSPLFPAEHLTSTEGRKKGRYISAIGSYRPHMCEIHPDILSQAVAPDHKHHHHKHADKGGVIVVDSLEACLKEAGEIIQAGITAEQLVEIGELLMVKKASMREIEMGTGEGEKGLRRWLDGGNVIYKSVGIGLMDICVGEDLVALAMERGVGTRVEGF
ncbi:MAG: hypothetical protein ALECFALPRED_005827 [Alectoria fallacina]|uniref:NAD(P)-binding protein n=1 Tax=Alectoria fallacina TaxID=1903189 RepID=A0A8H3G6S2_9LECA|nr:MAG: hypothetical protein ALECFALPRED_005827 [Alectoria fallacina]